MTERQAISELIACQKNQDIEVSHADADDVLCQFLEELGYLAIVEEYHKVRKWYA